MKIYLSIIWYYPNKKGINMSKSLNFYKLIGNVAELVDSSRNKTKADLNKFGGWQHTEDLEDFTIYETVYDMGLYRREERIAVLDTTGYYLFKNGRVLEEGVSSEEAWNHPITQQAFKKKAKQVLFDLAKEVNPTVTESKLENLQLESPIAIDTAETHKAEELIQGIFRNLFNLELQYICALAIQLGVEFQDD